MKPQLSCTIIFVSPEAFDLGRSCTYHLPDLVILDWEEHESVRVLLEDWLVGLVWLNAGCNFGCLWPGLDNFCYGLRQVGRLRLGYRLDRDRHVLLVLRVEVNLLDRRVFDLQALEGRSRLCDFVSSVTKFW